jgi:hypothetical protein
VNELAAVKPKTLGPNHYWRLWLLDAVLVGGGILFFLATFYGTWEFFGVACSMALLPFIPIMVLVGGGGSTVFALTKVWIDKRSPTRLTAVGLLVIPGVVVTLALVVAGVCRSPGHRLSYICLGNAPASASHVQITGYSTFLHAEWLAVFQSGQKDFQTMVAQSKMQPVDAFELTQLLAPAGIRHSRLFQSLPSQAHAVYFKRVFKEGEEHQRGRVYAGFDPVTSTAMVVLEYHD